MVDQASAQGESLITLQQLVDVNMRVKTTSMGQPSVAVDLKVSRFLSFYHFKKNPKIGS